MNQYDALDSQLKVHVDVSGDFEPAVLLPDMPPAIGFVPTEPKPAPLPVNADNLPREIKELPQFVMWCYRWRVNGRGLGTWDKPPLTISGRYAKSDDPATWATFAAVWAAYLRGGFDGIGLCFGGEVVGVDLDGCFNQDGTLKPWAADLLCDDGGLAIPTYTEYSPSGSGLHLIYFGTLPADLPRRRFNFGPHVGIEFYAFPSNRFFTVTGKRWGLIFTVTRIESVDLIPMIYYAGELMPRKPQIETPQAQTSPQVESLRSDDDVIRIAGRARNSDKVIALLRGDTARYPSASEADAALCAILAHYTRDASQIDRIFRRSGLYREKWDQRHYSDGATYGAVTIEKALTLGGAK